MRTAHYTSRHRGRTTLLTVGLAALTLLPWALSTQTADADNTQSSISQRRLSMMISDRQRPLVYGLYPGTGVDDAELIFINVDTERIEKSIPIGSNPTDMDISYAEGRLFVSNWRHELTRVVDLETQFEIDPLQLGNDVYKINALDAGRLIFEQEDQWVYGKVMDTRTGLRLGSVFLREGDGESSPAGDFYYHCQNNIGGAKIQKYDMATNSPELVTENSLYSFGSRNLVMSGDGSRLFCDGKVWDSDLKLIEVLGTEIFSTTYRGTLAIGSTHVLNVSNHEPICELPFDTSVSAVSGDDSTLILQNPLTNELVFIPIADIATLPDEALVPSPADDAMIALPLDQLTWSVDPMALAYRVYFGTDSSTVAAADEDSPEYLGQVDKSVIELPDPLELGTEYFWRVDPLGFSQIRHGDVWSFATFVLDLDPPSVATLMVTQCPPSVIEIDMTRSAPGVSDWHLVENTPWLSILSLSGRVPGQITLIVDAANLLPGVHETTFQISAAGQSFEYPVTLKLVPLALSKMVADFERPYVYGLHSGSGEVHDAFLVFISTDTEKVEKAIPIGANPTDMDINYPEGRLYVTNYGHELTRVVDLTTQLEVDPLALGPRGYRINALDAGRVIFDGQPPRVVDTETGVELARIPFTYQGDGEASPDGQFYYHCNSGSSGSIIRKFDVSSNDPTVVATSPQHAYGSRNLVMSGDGTRIFWHTFGYAYDADLVELGSLRDEVFAVSFDGRIAFGASAIYTVPNLAYHSDLPITTTVMAASPHNKTLFMFDPASNEIVTLSIPLVVGVQDSGLRAMRIDENAVVRWTLPNDKLGSSCNVFRQVGEGEPVRVRGDLVVLDSEYEFTDAAAPLDACLYWVEVVDLGGGTTVLGPVELAADAITPRLQAPNPNPFNARTVFRFSIATRGKVRLTIYSIRGSRVARVVDEVRAPGHHSEIWDGLDDRGHPAASGVYLVALSTADGRFTQKVCLIR